MLVALGSWLLALGSWLLAWGSLASAGSVSSSERFSDRARADRPTRTTTDTTTRTTTRTTTDTTTRTTTRTTTDTTTRTTTRTTTDTTTRTTTDTTTDARPHRHTTGNFQGNHACAENVLIGRPVSVDELREMVLAYQRVKASGVGHSWWADQFCAGGAADGDGAINIVTTELAETLAQIKGNVGPAAFQGAPPPAGFPIQVDEASRTVTVSAGIPQRMLLEYLAEYKYGTEPAGWTLPAFSYFIDQTIGGAVATGTHGSSFQHGSLSSQLTSLRLLLANGTVVDLSPGSHPHLFNAAAVSVGRLGIILDLTLKIVPDRLVERVNQDMNLLEFATDVKEVQDAYNAAMATGNATGAALALEELEATQAFWHPIANLVWRTDYEVVSGSDNAATLPWEGDGDSMVRIDHDSSNATSSVDDASGLLPGVYVQVENENRVGPTPAITQNPDTWGRVYPTMLRGMVTPVTTPASNAYVTMTESMNERQANNNPHDQFEAAVPISIAGDCLLGLNELVYSRPANETLADGFRTPPLIRFVKEEPFYLSPSSGTPVMYFNLEDHLTLSSGVPNDDFDAVMNYFLDNCDARLHWGKAGWPTHTPCFDGAEDYPETWCDFGCAVVELDPDGKFRSESDVWRWAASRAGEAVQDFGSCCTSAGFSSQCVCERSPIC